MGAEGRGQKERPNRDGKKSVKVAILQKTKWFGRQVYQVGQSMVLTHRRERPSKSDNMQSW